MVGRSGFTTATPSIEAQPRNSDLTQQDSGVFPSYPYLVPATANLVVGGTLTKNQNNQPGQPITGRSGYKDQELSAGFDFFEHAHVIPRSFDFGFVLATQVTDIEVYNAYRRTVISWDTYVNNAGAGVTLLGQPGLPVNVPAQGGIAMQLQVTTQGPAVVDSTLDFGFSPGGTLLVPILIERVVLFAQRPENEYDEFLEWLTDILRHKDGSEQRPSARENPRQFFEFDYFLDDGTERTSFENFLFDWQSRVFGVPIWHEEAVSTQAALVDDTTIFVDSTDYADFRVGGLCALIADEDTFDVVPIAVVNPTSIVLENGVLNPYPIGTAVLPLRTAEARASISGSRFLNNASTIKLRFRVLDNDVGGIADLSAFSSYNGRLLYDLFNFAIGGRSEQFDRQITVIDNQTGIVDQDSQWDRHRRKSGWGAVMRGKQAMWEHRQMLHAIRGRQTAWYLPTNRTDLDVLEDLVSAAATIEVGNTGYNQFVRERQARNVIRVTFNNGDPPLVRTILSSTVISATRETLTLDDTWPSAYTVAEIDRVEFVEKLRFDSDRIKIQHGGAGGRTAKITAPVRTVFN
jgi:hypothetical protein